MTEQETGAPVIYTDQVVRRFGEGAALVTAVGGFYLDAAKGQTKVCRCTCRAALVMGTRAGDVDAGVLTYLSRARGGGSGMKLRPPLALRYGLHVDDALAALDELSSRSQLLSHLRRVPKQGLAVRDYAF